MYMCILYYLLTQISYKKCLDSLKNSQTFLQMTPDKILLFLVWMPGIYKYKLYTVHVSQY